MQQTQSPYLNLLITGCNGQVGYSIKQYLQQQQYPEIKAIYTDRNSLDIANPTKVRQMFEQNPGINFVINTAAYTYVDKAESEPELAFRINTYAPQLLAQTCAQYGAWLLHLSTDFVFDGQKTGPYLPTDTPNPLNIYGKTKLQGEQAVLAANPNKTCVIRTSWVYANHGSNFVRTMLRLATERPQLQVVNDQRGSPTYAPDLAQALITICQQIGASNSHSYKIKPIYHYANGGSCTWYELAKTTLEYAQINCPVIPIAAHQYPTPAKRPRNSQLDTTDIVNDFNIEIPNWKISLKKCIGSLKNGNLLSKTKT
ncbi:MAG: dTDP-4-dehydrorhamnose reductase [Sphingobacteriales bacterium]|jgi:dTDP-4-dehydrorhamnose reductase|nr:dTDP-4-dehydrorhamnose reductase [Sphingobacteriales bacterium]MBP9140747.1 dTDP-4-dehydrorhamnose reductase [Chitinophagales bacterium]MDA0197866.1 dTDP-4-dehydrorhamnose reductase [Bacteroidota bacterium]MBK6889714.1 dTDP-4-dehydrorhamnose reductase [Sphingobacteriales bacterium]MBK7527771.1 dTDP-4-dehydrorhamnose reductase [Sphingobacteriales bacterium]